MQSVDKSLEWGQYLASIRADGAEAELTARTQAHFDSKRYTFTKRHYTAADVAALKSSIDIVTPSHYLSQKLYKGLRTSFEKKVPMSCYGALDNVQMINATKYLSCIYVSGWQCSSTHIVGTNEPGPDFADYPMNTLPDKVDQFVKAQMLHDRKQNEERSKMTEAEKAATPRRDYFKPCIADADAGFGGITSVMKLTKLFVEAGAAGMHLEDQKPGVKKCGHLGGKVLVSVREHLTRLQAARLQSDIMGADICIVARTDSLDASFLDNNVDPIDHPWIMGCVDPNDLSKTMTFVDAGLASMKKNLSGKQLQDAQEFWNKNAKKISLQDAQKYAKDHGFAFYFDWESNRTDEGYYKLKRGDIEYPIRRAIAFADYADIIWPETHSPDLEQAKAFADGVHAEKPNAMLGYNNSPSFNWDLYFKTPEELEAWIPSIGKLGFVWQFVTLAGFHMNALMSEVFSRNFAEKGMHAYVEYIQRKEKQEKVDQLLHQKWSGANLKDREVNMASAGKASSIANDAKGESTEKQFAQVKM